VAVVDTRPPRLQGQHHDVGAVLLNFEGLERISDEQEVAIKLGSLRHGVSGKGTTNTLLSPFSERTREHLGYRATLLPNSTTALFGRFKKSAAPLALRCICENNFSRQ